MLVTFTSKTDGDTTDKTYLDIFYRLCRTAYVAIRRKHEQIIRLILPFVDAGLTDLSHETLQYVRSSVRLDLSENDACDFLIDELEKVDTIF